MRSLDINKYFGQCFGPESEGDFYLVGVDYRADHYGRNVYDGVLRVNLTEEFWTHLEEKSSYSIYPGSVCITVQNSDFEDGEKSISPLLQVTHKDTRSLLFSKTLTIPFARKFFDKNLDKIEADDKTCLYALNAQPNASKARTSSDNSVLDELALFTAKGQQLLMPKQRLMHYPKLKNLLQTAGGTYTNNAFIFEVEAQEILDRLLSGETVNDKKKYQFFETTDKLGDKLISKLDIKPEDEWLEPSAGRARIADKMKEISEKGTLIELMPLNVTVLKEKGYNPIEADFTTVTTEMLGKQFDKIGANPPFTNDQDIIHIRHMFDEHLKAGGRLSSYASQSWLKGSNKRQVEFKNWLNELGADIEMIEEGEFKESGTSIPTTLITIQKAA